jgi:hypothetical protein
VSSRTSIPFERRHRCTISLVTPGAAVRRRQLLDDCNPDATSVSSFLASSDFACTGNAWYSTGAGPWHSEGIPEGGDDVGHAAATRSRMAG